MAGEGWFTTSGINTLYLGLKVPSPQNPSAILGRLRSDHLAISRTSPRGWALTPLGKRKAVELLGKFRYEDISAELAGTPGADFGQERHTVIPPEFAPVRWQAGISRLLDRFPFETNVFLMTRYPNEGKEFADPIKALIGPIRTTLAQHGLSLHLASDRQADDDLLGNVGAHMWASQYGIGILDIRDPKNSTLNDNMLIELGSMLVTGRRCKILKDKNAPRPPTDLAGQIYATVNLDDVKQVTDTLHLWVAEDLGLGRCAACPPSTDPADETASA